MDYSINDDDIEGDFHRDNDDPESVIIITDLKWCTTFVKR